MKRYLFIAFSVLLLGACSLDRVPLSNVTVTLSVPDSTLKVGKDNYTVRLTNIATGRVVSITTDKTGIVKTTLEEGVYNVSASGEKTITTSIAGKDSIQTFTQTVSIQGTQENAVVSGESTSLNVALEIAQKGNGFVLKEIYFSGSTTPAGGSYYQDQFLEIYNNSDSVLYADGLSVVESAHSGSNSVAEFTDYPGYFIVQALYTIPGSGTDYPVEPGKSIIIASMGINHKEANAKSPVDLSKANFEWYDGGKDVDVPEVPNLIRNFCYSNTLWILYVKGYRSYAIFKANEDYSTFLSKNTISVLTASGSSVTRVKVPTSLIIDGVEVGSAGTIGTKALPSSIDLSYTYCTASYSGKSVRRKVLKWENGRAILQDTNNSGSDFIPDATPMPGKVE